MEEKTDVQAGDTGAIGNKFRGLRRFNVVMVFCT